MPGKDKRERKDSPGKSAPEGSLDQLLLNVGFGGTVVADRVVAIIPPNSAPMKRLKDEAKEERRLVDATHGRKTRSVIVMDSNHIILSAIQAETVAARYLGLREAREARLREVLDARIQAPDLPGGGGAGMDADPGMNTDADVEDWPFDDADASDASEDYE